MTKKSRIAAYILYALLYIVLPMVFVVYAFNQEYDIPTWAQILSNTVGFGFVFFIAVAVVLSTSTFPDTWRKVGILFIPFVINGLVIYFNQDTVDMVSALVMHSVITYVGLVVGYLLMAFTVPWQVGDKNKFIDGFTAKYKYLKKIPSVWVAFVVLLLPLSFGFYLFMIGWVMASDVYESVWKISSGIMYLLMVFNVTFFHLRAAKVANKKIFGTE